MKIGILTQPLHNNYGGLLQNFALQHVLRENGHEPITLDWEPLPVPRWRKYAFAAKCWICKYLLRKETTSLLNYEPSDIENEIISRNNRRFMDEFLNYTGKLTSSKDFQDITISEGLQALIAGSDQCWRPNYAGGRIYDMYFRFAENLSVKRIAYAASFGTNIWEYTNEQTEECKRLIQLFNLVTVREESGVDLCQRYLNARAIHVLDPTMLIDKSVYLNVIKSLNSPQSKGNLFYYILDPNDEKMKIIETVAEYKGLRQFTVMPIYQAENRTRYNVKNEIDKCVFPGVEEWLRAFIDAEMIICDSFHGCVFSIIFNKPFWVIGNASRGNTRFASLLKLFGLEDRLISVNDDIDIDLSIDWNRVNKILEEERTLSRKLLINVLS